MNQDELNALRDKVLATVDIGGYVRTNFSNHKRKELHNGFLVQCLLPGHADKTPSMLIRNNTYYCFSCREGGDIISLVRRVYNLSYIEALRKLDGYEPSEKPNRSTSRHTTKTIEFDSNLLKQYTEKVKTLLPNIPQAEPYFTSQGISPESLPRQFLTMDTLYHRFFYYRTGDGKKHYVDVSPYVLPITLTDNITLEKQVLSVNTRRNDALIWKLVENGSFNFVREDQKRYYNNDLESDAALYQFLLDQIPRYMKWRGKTPSDIRSFYGVDILYRIEKNKYVKRKFAAISLLEGEKKPQVALDMGLPALGIGTNAGLDRLPDFTDNLFIIRDNDEEGLKIAKRIYTRLQDKMEVKILTPNKGKGFDDWVLEEGQQSVLKNLEKYGIRPVENLYQPT